MEERIRKGMGPVGMKPTRARVALTPFVSMLEDLKYMLTPKQRDITVALAEGTELPEDDYIEMAGNLSSLVSERIIEKKWKNGEGKVQPKLTSRGSAYYQWYLK